MKEQEIIQLITRVLANEASVEEQQQVELWRKESPQQELRYKEMLLIWNNALPEEVDTQKAWQKFSAQLDKQPKVFKLNKMLKVAAAVILIGTVGLFVAKLAGRPSYQTISTASNEIKEISLPDGSVAWLNQGSTLTYEKSFKGDIRAITLNGEAFFEVVKNPTKPFVITSDYSVTQVLGTSFNLDTRKGKTALLTVITGKVSFTAKTTKEEVIVAANESAIIDTDGHALKEEKNDVNALAWKTNTLSFQDTPLDEVFKTLEHYFNIKIEVDNKRIYNCHLTADFEKPTVKMVMDVIGKSLQLTYEQKGKRVFVKGDGCK